MAQRDCGVEPGRAARGEQARQECGGAQQRDYAEQRHPIGHRHLEDLAAQNPRQQDACRQTHGKARKDE